MTTVRLGITGGIGSGKSVVSRVLQTLGIPVFDCDAQSKRLTVSHPDIRRQLVELVGPEVYTYSTPSNEAVMGRLASSPSKVEGVSHRDGGVCNSMLRINSVATRHSSSKLDSALAAPESQLSIVNSQLNKKLLASFLFASADHVQRVNSIIHPVLKDYFRQWVTEQHTPLVAIESAILFEAGYDDVVDSVVMVSAPLEVRIARAMQRDGATRSAVEERIRQQMDDHEKQRRSQFVLINDGQAPIIPQVLDIINTLSQK